MTVRIAPARPRIDPRIRQRRVSVTRQLGRRRLHVLLLGCAAVAAGVGAALVLHSSLLSARHLTVRGAVHTPRNLVLDVGGLSNHPPLIDVNPGRVSSRLERLPWVASAVVHKQWPDSLTIDLTERTPLVFVAAGGGFDEVDVTGRVLSHEQTMPSGALTLAVSDAGFRAPTKPGSVLARGASPGLLVAANIPSVLRQQTQGVAVSGAAVILTLQGGLDVVFGTADELQQKFESLASLLSTARPSGPARIDLTVPDELSVTPGAA